MSSSRSIAIAASVALSVLGASMAAAFFHYHKAIRPRVDFSRDIRPILNQSCVSCHGGVRQKNNVSFIYREEALGRGKSGRPTIVPGHPETSELMARVTSADPEARMPYGAPPLQTQQIALLKQWIEEGAPWEDHWAFVAPKPRPPPGVKNTAWPRQPVDRFILARLEREGLNASPEADRASLLRRLSFDLTGLPPTAEELSVFIADTSADAYQKQVDRLLASPHYGERWASMWLDLARYADTKGYEKDLKRSVWPYRDWVIDAFNRNLPYDRFVIAQLAGDLLPNAAMEEQIATCFQRLTPANDEGGTDDEEFRLVAVMDRAATTWSVLNGVTMNCVQCHSHPYDPIRHTEYYKFLGFYNTSRDADLWNDSPVLRVPKDRRRYAEAFYLQQEISALRGAIVASGRQLAGDEQQWKTFPIVAASANEVLGLERRMARLKAEAQHPLESPLAAYLSLPANEIRKLYVPLLTEASAQLAHAKLKAAAAKALDLREGEAWALESTPKQSVYELMAKAESSPLTALRIEVPPLDSDRAGHTPEEGFIVDGIEAWVVQPDGREDRITFGYFAADSTDTLQIVSAPLARPVTASNTPEKPVDRRRDAGFLAMPSGVGSAFSADSKLFRTRWKVCVPNAPVPLAPGSRIKVQLTQTQNFLQEEKPAHVRRVKVSASNDTRWTALSTDAELTRSLDRLGRLSRRLQAIATVPVPIMADQADYERRQTLEFERGNFLTKIGPALIPDVPGLFPKLPASAPRNRLTMAQWFFAPGQPLTARVAANRYWEELFGNGLVETLEDFGSAGEAPSHPELLDWLALHFQNDLHWDMKALLRELVSSATYRQTAKTAPALLQKDPSNRLLTRGPQQRLTAEMVRDQALLASGLLTPTMGGPPVVPPRLHGRGKSIEATASDRYRRAIYTFLKRRAIYPNFLTFDGSGREVSLARRTPTNTPLQALVTLNDPVYQEAADALARRMLAINGGASAPSGRLSARPDGVAAVLNYGAERVLSRDLTPKEYAALRAFYEDLEKMPATGFYKTAFKNESRSAKSPASNNLAALTAVASALLNLDAALTR